MDIKYIIIGLFILGGVVFTSIYIVIIDSNPPVEEVRDEDDALERWLSDEVTPGRTSGKSFRIE